MNAVTPRSKLKAVAPKAAAPSKPKCLIYGKPGVGKTWASLDFPSVYYIDTEGGADLAHYTAKLEQAGGVYLGPNEGSTDFGTVLDQVKALAIEEHPYRTLVIDSISKLFNDTVAREAERLGDKNGFGADKKPAVANMRMLVAWLTRLDMNVLLIAHEKDEYGLNAKGERDLIGATFDCWDKLEYELHLAMRITKQGTSRVARVRKSRLLGFPENTSLPWSYDEFAERYGRAVLEADSKALELASAEQVAEMERLLSVVKMPEEQVEKWLKAGNAASWVEMDADKIAKCIAALKSKING